MNNKYRCLTRILVSISIFTVIVFFQVVSVPRIQAESETITEEESDMEEPIYIIEPLDSAHTKGKFTNNDYITIGYIMIQVVRSEKAIYCYCKYNIIEITRFDRHEPSIIHLIE